MADNIQIPANVAKVFEVKDTSKPLQTFLLTIANRMNDMQKQIDALELRVKALEP